MKRIAAAVGAMLLLGSCGGDDPEISRAAALLSLPDTAVPVCNDVNILGAQIEPIDGAGRCGIERPVRVYAVDGVRLAPSARMNCSTARTLKSWVRGQAQPIAADIGTRISELRVAAGYACRSRNSQRGARISEHAKGNAIDISAFRFANGDTVPVLGAWKSGKYSKTLRRLHSSACGPFGTVLGPNSDRFHQDHFHFDTADYRSGSYCR